MFLIAYVGTALIIMVVVMGISAYLAKRKGKNPVKWALLSAFGLFVFVFWDYYPTKWTHQYYCEKEAGFWVYKTIDQWNAENPGVMEGLVTNKGAPLTRQGDMQNYIDTYFLNLRINKVVKQIGKLPINRWQHEQEIVDTKTGEVLARYVDFSTAQERRQAGWSGWKFWLDSSSCIGGESNYGNFLLFKRTLQGAGK